MDDSHSATGSTTRPSDFAVQSGFEERCYKRPTAAVEKTGAADGSVPGIIVKYVLLECRTSCDQRGRFGDGRGVRDDVLAIFTVNPGS